MFFICQLEFHNWIVNLECCHLYDCVNLLKLSKMAPTYIGRYLCIEIHTETVLSLGEI